VASLPPRVLGLQRRELEAEVLRTAELDDGWVLVTVVTGRPPHFAGDL